MASSLLPLVNIPAVLEPGAALADLFPVKTQRCYLNNASIGPIAQPVLDAVTGFLTTVRDTGRNGYPEWCRHLDGPVKQRIGSFLGAHADEIAFVKNTTEGLNYVSNGLDWRAGDNVVLADIEYPSNVYPWMLQAKHGVGLRWVAARQGRVELADVEAACDERTRVIAISAVQFATGHRADLAGLSELCERRGILLCVDAIQWCGVLDLDLSQYKIDFLAFGGHKWMLSPIGTGVFYISRNALNAIQPSVVGYHSVDRGEAHMDYDLDYRPNAGRFEEALVNMPGIWGLDASIAIKQTIGMARIEAHCLALADHAADRLSASGWTVTSPRGPVEGSAIVCFRADGVDPEATRILMAERGVDLAVRGTGLRISPTYYNDIGEIDRFVDALPPL